MCSMLTSYAKVQYSSRSHSSRYLVFTYERIPNIKTLLNTNLLENGISGVYEQISSKEHLVNEAR